MKKINNPIPIKVKGNKVYFWCACGKSANQPFCDGSHKNTNFSPIKLESLKNEEIYFWRKKFNSHYRFNSNGRFS